MPKVMIVNTDNFGGDYPDEFFLARLSEERAQPMVFLSKDEAQLVVDSLNAPHGPNAPRWWKIVDEYYQLIRGFRP
jgi:hypothetical protein